MSIAISKGTTKKDYMNSQLEQTFQQTPYTTYKKPARISSYKTVISKRDLHLMRTTILVMGLSLIISFIIIGSMVKQANTHYKQRMIVENAKGVYTIQLELREIVEGMATFADENNIFITQVPEHVAKYLEVGHQYTVKSDKGQLTSLTLVNK